MQRAITSIMGPSRTSFPVTDTIETSDYYQLESELPGYKKQDIEVRITNANTLVLTGSLHESSDSEHSTHRRMHQVHQEAEQAHTQEKQAEQQRQQALQEAEQCQASLTDKVSATESKSRLAEAKEAEMAKCKLAAQAQETQVKESKAAAETSQLHAQKVAQEDEEAKKKAESGQASVQGRKKSILGHAKEFIDTQAKNVQVEMKQAQVSDANKAAEEQQKKVDDAMKKAEQAQKEYQAMEATKSQEVKDIKSQVQGGEAETQELKEKVQVKQEQASGDKASGGGRDKASGDEEAVSEERQRPVKARYLSVERNVVEYFSRVFTFSCNIEGEQVKATFQNGILQVLVPKSKAGVTHHINI
ncbi:hypothetical protein EDC94DRAFT_592975, partial [Helicostylum pulchrum]